MSKQAVSGASFTRIAHKDGHELVTLRSFDRKGGYFVECEVYPVSGLRVDPLRPGPYTFPSREEADSFIDDAMQTLQLLGCDVS